MPITLIEKSFLLAFANHAIIAHWYRKLFANSQSPIQQEVKTNPQGIDHDKHWFMNVPHEWN
jgi:hypothetical protein